MSRSVVDRYRRPAAAPRPASMLPERSVWFVLAVVGFAALAAVWATDLYDPASRLGLKVGSLAAFFADWGFFGLLFAPGAALLWALFDISAAWERATPESERQRADGDGGVFDMLGFGGGSDGCDGDGGTCD